MNYRRAPGKRCAGSTSKRSTDRQPAEAAAALHARALQDAAARSPLRPRRDQLPPRTPVREVRLRRGRRPLLPLCRLRLPLPLRHCQTGRAEATVPRRPAPRPTPSTRASAWPATCTTPAWPSASPPPSASAGSTRARSCSLPTPRRQRLHPLRRPRRLPLEARGVRPAPALRRLRGRRPGQPLPHLRPRRAADRHPRRRRPDGPGTNVLPQERQLPRHRLLPLRGRRSPTWARAARGRLELYNPLTIQAVEVRGRSVPLETDLTTPLAYFLADTDLERVGYDGLPAAPTRCRTAPASTCRAVPAGQDPGGVGPRPAVVAADLDAAVQRPAGRPGTAAERYQFWFYFYPTGDPYLLTAADLRAILDELARRPRPAPRGPGVRRHGAGRPQHGRPGVASC